jgi:hypothetical protein
MVEPDTKAQEDEIMRAVGECITEWAAVERCLALLYCECVGDGMAAGNQPKPLSQHIAVFDAVVSIDARLDMIQAALRWRSGLLFDPSLTPPPYMDEWKSLRSRIRKKYVMRSELAHSEIARTGREGKPPLVWLKPFPTITSAFSKAMLTLDALAQRKELFEKLSGEIFTFQGSIRATPMIPPKSS